MKEVSNLLPLPGIFAGPGMAWNVDGLSWRNWRLTCEMCLFQKKSGAVFAVALFDSDQVSNGLVPNADQGLWFADVGTRPGEPVVLRVSSRLLVSLRSSL